MSVWVKVVLGRVWGDYNTILIGVQFFNLKNDMLCISTET